jgi:hypothetical protein
MNAKNKTQQILSKVIKIYHMDLAESVDIQRFLRNQCGDMAGDVVETFSIGYSCGRLLEMLPSKGDLLDQVSQLGIVTEHDQEYFSECVTVPLYGSDGEYSGMCGVHINNGGLCQIGTGVFNPTVFKHAHSMILVDDMLDALRLISRGIHNVSLLSNPALELMMSSGINTVFVLQPKSLIGFEVFNLNIVSLKDYFNDATKEDFEQLMSIVRNGGLKSKDFFQPMEVVENGLRFSFANRCYLIRGIDASKQRLKVNIKAVCDDRFHIDTLDLYVARARKNLARDVSLLYGEEMPVIEKDLNVMIVEIEKFVSGKIEGQVTKAIDEASRKKAIDFLSSETLMDQILKDFDDLGCCGETTNKLVGYIAAVSRKLNDPLSLLVLSRSAAGKSMLQDTILSLVPDEDKSKYTRITGQALFYKGEDSLKHKIIAIEEEEGSSQAAYSIRTMQSSKQLTIASTIKDPLSGVMKTQEYKVNGPLSLMMTTTSNEIDYETMNRFIVLTIDETAEQTRLIHEKQRQRDTLMGFERRQNESEIIERHQNAQRLLKPLTVINPYAPELTYMDSQLRARRDNQKYLNLIKAITFLRQYQRPVKMHKTTEGEFPYIETTLDDIRLANELAKVVLAQSLQELSPQSRQLLNILQRMTKEREEFTRKDIRDASGWSDYQVRTHLKQLLQLEYVTLTAGKNGSLMKYRVLYGDPFEQAMPVIGLTEVESLSVSTTNINLTV